MCVEAPKRSLRNAPPFVLKPSLLPVLKFLIETLHEVPHLQCGVCEKTAFPEDPSVKPHRIAT